jgi:trimeric autotransporter adhesin
MSQADNLAALATNVNSSGVLQPASGGTGATTTAGAANAILPSQTGNTGKYLTTNGTDTSWGTVTSNPGTVTSVGGTGTVNGITLTGTVTSSGNLTLGGTLSGVALGSQVSGTLPIANGGTGETTRQAAIDALAGAVTSGQYLRGNGTDVVMSAIQAADVPTLNQNTTGNATNLSGSAFSASSTGYYTIRSSGLIIQWGVATLGANTRTTATFAITFPNAVWSVTGGTDWSPAGGGGWCPNGACPNTTSSCIVFSTNDSGSNNVWYIAVGY